MAATLHAEWWPYKQMDSNEPIRNFLRLCKAATFYASLARVLPIPYHVALFTKSLDIGAVAHVASAACGDLRSLAVGSFVPTRVMHTK